MAAPGCTMRHLIPPIRLRDALRADELHSSGLPFGELRRFGRISETGQPHRAAGQWVFITPDQAKTRQPACQRVNEMPRAAMRGKGAGGLRQHSAGRRGFGKAATGR